MKDYYTSNEIYNDGIDFNKVPDEAKIKSIKKNPFIIHYLANPSIDLQLLAVKTSPKALTYLRNAPEEVQIVAVKGDPGSLNFIKTPSQNLINECKESMVKFLVKQIVNGGKNIQKEGYISINSVNSFAKAVNAIVKNKIDLGVVFTDDDKKSILPLVLHELGNVVNPPNYSNPTIPGSVPYVNSYANVHKIVGACKKLKLKWPELDLIYQTLKDTKLK